MEIQEIIDSLQFNTERFPRRAIQQAIANREAITPQLIEILEYVEQNIDEVYEQEKYMAHIYALYLLAQFREKHAYPLIYKFFSIPGEISLDVTGDLVTEALDRILASVSHGDTSLIKSLLENEEANDYVRNAALRALMVLVVQGQLSREEMVEYCKSLFREKLTREHSHIWNGLTVVSTELYPEELYEDIKQAFDEELVDPFFVGIEDVQKSLEEGKEKVLATWKNNERYHFIADVVHDMECWACFKPPQKLHSKTSTVKAPKIGRNQPCPCGSGKKYKKCCGK